jgi:hypothetical protein
VAGTCGLLSPKQAITELPPKKKKSGGQGLWTLALITDDSLANCSITTWHLQAQRTCLVFCGCKRICITHNYFESFFNFLTTIKTLHNQTYRIKFNFRLSNPKIWIV